MNLQVPTLTSVPATDEGSGFASGLGDLLLGYAQSRAAIDLQNRAEDLNQPDRVDVATQAQQTATAGGSLLGGTALGNPWVIAGIVLAGVVGGLVIYKVL